MAVDYQRVIDELRPVGGMVLVQVAFAGLNVFYKLAMNDGMSVEVLVAYRYLFAAGFLCPVAFLVERKKRPGLTWIILTFAFLSGLFGGALVQNLYIAGIKLTSVTFAFAMSNLVPAITFILAVAFGLERLGFGTLAGQAKVTGTLVAIGGAMLLTFYKGPELNLWSSSVHLLHAHSSSSTRSSPSLGKRVTGSMLSVGACLSYALWLIIQAKMSKLYPCPYSSTALMSMMGSLQAVAYALCAEGNNWRAWRLGFNVRLLTVVYSGVVASGLVMTLLAWCIKKKGPLFASVFNPLMLVLVAILESLLLDEKLHLGSVSGSMLIVLGLYLVLWGKGREATGVKELPITTQGPPFREGSIAASLASGAMNHTEQHE